MPPYDKKKKKVDKSAGGKKSSKSKSTSVCKFYQRGKCFNRNCPYLHVKEAGGDVSTIGSSEPGAEVLITLLKLFFEKHQNAIYDPVQGVLDLSNLTKYADFESVVKNINFNTKNFCVALCNCVSRLISPLPSVINFAKNQITSIAHLSRAMVEADMHLSLRALSLADNKLNDVQVLSHELKRFTNLMEIDLRNNPLCEPDNYRSTIKKKMAWLQMLDAAPLAAAPLSLCWPIFKDASLTLRDEADVGKAYSTEEKHILQFLQTSYFDNVERCSYTNSSSGTNSGVDSISDIYARDATFSLTLTCSSAAVSTPSRTAGGSRNVDTQREVIREVVAFRLRQTEANHNLIEGKQSSVKVACGRTEVCTQLSNLLYPSTFVVAHFIHESPSVVIMDNKGNAPGAAEVSAPFTLVTLHGVMMWRHTPVGPKGASTQALMEDNNSLREALVIKRNFSRVITIVNSEPGRWHIANDAITLSPFRGRELEDADVLAAADSLTSDNILFRDIHNYDVVFSPKLDPHRSALYGRRYNVPSAVVRQLCQYVSTDMELSIILQDLTGVPMEAFEHCATLVGGDPLGAIFLCRLGNKYQVAPEVGAGIVANVGYNWESVVQQAMNPS